MSSECRSSQISVTLVYETSEQSFSIFKISPKLQISNWALWKFHRSSSIKHRPPPRHECSRVSFHSNNNVGVESFVLFATSFCQTDYDCPLSSTNICSSAVARSFQLCSRSPPMPSWAKFWHVSFCRHPQPFLACLLREKKNSVEIKHPMSGRHRFFLPNVSSYNLPKQWETVVEINKGKSEKKEYRMQ